MSGVNGDGLLRVDRTEHDGGGQTVTGVGEIDITTARQFDDALSEAARCADGRLWVDLTGVTYFGSEGVRTIVRALELARTRDVQVSVSCSPQVRRVLEVTGLGEIADA